MEQDTHPEESTILIPKGQVRLGGEGSRKRKLSNGTRADRPRTNLEVLMSESLERRQRLHEEVFYPGLYAPSGFDMMSILIRVATRPKPKINLGAIDSNCAILLCDTLAKDMPIVYCSEAFELLTGYQSSEIIGRNCRFLQSSKGILDPEERRRRHSLRASTARVQGDNFETAQDELSEREEEILNDLKIRIEQREEAQIIVTNYKKGGTPFTNLLTTIPVVWDSDSDQSRYIVGFQADLMKCVG